MGGRRGNGGKIKWKLSEVNTRAVYRGQNELIGELKMTEGDVVIIGIGNDVHGHSKRN